MCTLLKQSVRSNDVSKLEQMRTANVSREGGRNQTILSMDRGGQAWRPEATRPILISTG